ncbi:hypothetical protein LTR62_004003 [Meristemomyces frigidus]|uniref:Uncharacterized protein n=1 Tax=Meristemomyces frigidus TaxID=1508187 RepID=A0AAN7TQ09_9PEZI|nr:hypothetical protein LTR62_004003 [Meristemomyces frigidus]
MSGKDKSLYGIQKQRNLAGGREISSSTTLSFTSQLSSLISSSNSTGTTKSTPRARAKKEDIFSTHNRNTAKRAKRDLEDSSAFTEQKHTTNGEALDRNVWERSKRKMKEKARLYAAMKRGDVEDVDERYAVDFDRKWAENKNDDDDEDDDDSDTGPAAQVEYVDEFGRTRTGTTAEASRAERLKRGAAAVGGEDDRFTARPSAPANIIYGDTIQHQAFDPDEPIAAQMEVLARKRDKSLTPPPDLHFDASREIRTKGTGFFQFSEDAGERQRQMEDLERERVETDRVRGEKQEKVEERRNAVEARRQELLQKRGKRKADEFLEQLGQELAGGGVVSEIPASSGDDQDLTHDMEMLQRIEGAVEREKDEG